MKTKVTIFTLILMFYSVDLMAEKIWSFGSNASGQLGLNDCNIRYSPIQMGADTCWNRISCGYYHTMALKNDSSLWAWGSNSYGQFGDSSRVSSNIPVRIGTERDWAIISCGREHTIAIKRNGTLWAWGNNLGGSLGIGTQIIKISPTQIGTDSNWVSVACGEYHNLAIKSDGTLWAWGYNSNGQVGDSTIVDKLSPIQITNDTDWISVRCGAEYSIGLKRNGTLWGWGRNNYGQIGDGTTTTRLLPVQIGEDTEWKQVSCGMRHTLALRSDGTLWAWGRNSEGQLGNGESTQMNYPIQINTADDWKIVECGGHHTLSIKLDGTLWVWGDNQYGQLGLGDGSLKKLNPTQVGVSNKWSFITAELDNSLCLSGQISVPKLISPSNSAKNLPITPTLIWSSIDGSSSYEVLVIKNNLTILDTVLLQDTTVLLNCAEFNKGYSWRVRALSSEEFGMWSESWNFVVEKKINNCCWSMESPYPTGNQLNCIEMTDTNTLIVGGERGLILKSTDGGSTWVKANSNIDNSIMSIKFANSSTGWACGVGSGGMIMKTTDGGLNWKCQTSGNMTGLYALHFYNSMVGWCVGYGGKILKTIDGGANWVSQVSGTSYDLYDVVFVNDQTGWAAGNNGKIIRTTNGGTTWVSQSSGTNYNLRSMTFESASIGWAAGYNGTLLKTINGGNSWTPQNLSPSSGITKIYRKNDNSLWAVSNSNILKSTNSGSSWQTIALAGVEGNYLRAIYFNSASSGFVVGDQGFIFKSTNQGSNWLPVQTILTNSQLSDVCFADATTVYAAGTLGTVLKSTNSGQNWFAPSSQALPFTITSIHFFSRDSGVIAGTNGNVYLTNNGGVTWLRKNTGVFQTLQSMSFPSNSVGYIVGSIDTVIKTTDGGNTWVARRCKTNPGSLYSMFFIDENVGWICGESGKIYKTVNGGANWFSCISGTELKLLSIHFLNENDGWAVGYSNAVIRTSNGGASWFSSPIISGGLLAGGSNIYTHVYFMNDNVGWIVPMYKTTNGGIDWELQESDIYTTTYRAAFYGEYSAIGVGASRAGIIKRLSCPENAPSLPIALIYPPDKTSGYSDSLNLLWSSTPNGNLYNVQLSDDPNFQTKIIDTLISDTTLMCHLPTQDKYYWRVLATNSIYSSPFSSIYSFATGGIRQSIYLRQGWNLVSTRIMQSPSDLYRIIIQKAPSIFLLKNGKDEFASEAFGINQLSTSSTCNVFSIYSTFPDSICFVGEEIEPSSNPISLRAGWNTVPYVNNMPLAASTALSSISEYLKLLYNQNGELYIPSEGINTLEDGTTIVGQMVPGKGYYIYVSQDCVLQYPSN